MRMLFIDETQCQQVDSTYFGVGALLFNSYSYKNIKESYTKAISDFGWDVEKEFKGKALFSAKYGDININPEERINLTTIALESLSSSTYSRSNFRFAYNHKGKSENNYLDLISEIVKNLPAIPRSEMGGGKNLLLVVIDNELSFNQTRIVDKIKQNLKTGYCLIEEPYFVNSKTAYCGLVLADILAYLKTWVILRGDEQTDLFGVVELNEANARKLETARDLISRVKNIASRRVG